ncbi:acyl-CoA thioesterase [Indiicoccus explosivorum]|uniref:acyl-CoA thioesterase n=1 Tax=Indiicoccus explosivorum TaxID=1917864 RepID=UPI000B43A615|nr:acyl-CoA thioesterase [Indiicoccus explosivorum]
MRASYINDLEEWKDGFGFAVPVTVRFSETDMFGHLNNTVPFTYFEFARTEYFKHLGLMQCWLERDSGTIPVVADLQCDYAKQVYFDEELHIHVKAENVGRSSVDIHYMATDRQGTVCLTGRGTIVQMAKATGKSEPWAEADKELFGLAEQAVG